MSASGSGHILEDEPVADADLEALCKRALAGRHLPAVADLIRGCPFLKDDMAADARAFAALMRKQIGASEQGEAVAFTLTELSLKPDLDRFVIAATVLAAHVGTRFGRFALTEAAAARCHFYAAISGRRDSICKVAAFAVSAFYASDLPPAGERSLAAGTAGWLMASSGRLDLPREWSRLAAAEFMARAVAPGTGAQLAERMVETRQALLARPAGTAPDAAEHWAAPDAVTSGTPSKDSTTAVVINAVGNSLSVDGKRIHEEFASILGEPLPILDLGTLERARDILLDEYPHAGPAIRSLLGSQAISGGRFAPAVLVGSEGCGKTSLAVRLAELLSLPSEIVPCAATADGTVTGTPRRWSTGEPSLPLSIIRTSRHASPVIVLDELDKAASGRVNGCLWDALHGLLDDRTARVWRDPYAEAPCDLSGVVWMATANTMEDVPRALVDRLRVIRVPAPGIQHLSALANRLLVSAALAKGLDPRWAGPLDQMELAALASFWPGGSLRRLARLISAIASAREREHARH